MEFLDQSLERPAAAEKPAGFVGEALMAKGAGDGLNRGRNRRLSGSPDRGGAERLGAKVEIDVADDRIDLQSRSALRGGRGRSHRNQ